MAGLASTYSQSFAGHYVPALSARIMAGNANHDGLHINLDGVGIGDGLVDPYIQYQVRTGRRRVPPSSCGPASLVSPMPALS